MGSRAAASVTEAGDVREISGTGLVHHKGLHFLEHKGGEVQHKEVEPTDIKSFV